jgi:hypothetical protein
MMSSSISRPAARRAPRGSRRNNSAFFDDLLIHCCSWRSTLPNCSRRRSDSGGGVLRRRKPNTSRSIIVEILRARVKKLSVFKFTLLNNFERYRVLDLRSWARHTAAEWNYSIDPNVLVRARTCLSRSCSARMADRREMRRHQPCSIVSFRRTSSLR